MDNNSDFLKDWLEGKISPEELTARKEKGDTLVKDFDELIARSSQLKVPNSNTKEDAWNKLAVKLTDTRKQEAKVVKFSRWIPVSIAASVTLMIVTFLVFNKTTVTTQLAETKTQVLPDGSEVTLNADSKVTFNRWLDQRTVTLEGEAFFSVKKGSVFAVESENGIVTVLGTSFNVNARTSRFEVSCSTGKVKVVSGEKSVVLTKGLFTKLGTSGLTNAGVFDTKKTTWRDGDFYFEGTALGEVMGELERQFNIEIIFQGDDSRLYTGYFSNKDIDEALEMVFKPMSLTYQRENNKITVK
jgi:ferric-dicitrate binding protein FerR (iron transport regulator)